MRDDHLLDALSGRYHASLTSIMLLVGAEVRPVSPDSFEVGLVVYNLVNIQLSDAPECSGHCTWFQAFSQRARHAVISEVY